MTALLLLTAFGAGLALVLAALALGVAVAGLGALSVRVDAMGAQLLRLQAKARAAAAPPVAPQPAAVAPEVAPTGAPEVAPAGAPETAPAVAGAAGAPEAVAPPVLPEAAVGPEAPPTPAKPPSPPFALPSIERMAAIFAALLGGLTLLLGFVLFVGVALSRGWIGPGARMFGAFTVASAVWVAGDALRKRSPWVGSALAGAGFVGLLAAIYATHSVYGFLGGTTATVAMLAACAVAGLSAVRHDDRAAGHLSLIGALLIPVLLSTGEDKSVAFFAYLTLVTTFTVATSAWKGWPDLLVTAAGGTGLLYLGWTASWFSVDHAPVALVALLALSAPYLATALAGRGYTRPVAIAVLAAWPLVLALPWLTPIHPTFTDPTTSRQVAHPLAWLAAVQALALPVLSAPLWLVGRARGNLWLSLLATAIAALHLGLWFTGWGAVALITPAPHADAAPWILAALWAIALPTALHLAGRQATYGVSPLPMIGGAALAVAFGLHTVTSEGGLADGLVVAGLTAALLAATGGLVPRGTAAGLPFAALGAGLLLLLASVARLPGLGLPWVGAGLFGVDNPYAGIDAWYAWRVPAWGPALGAVAALAIVPLGLRWSDRDRRWALAGAALAPIALGPALVTQWLLAIGRPGVGAVPLALGGVAVVGALATIRIHGGTRAQLAPAAFVLVALTGVNLAVPIELHDGWLSVALALELVAIAGVARVFTHAAVRVVAAPLAVAVGIRLLANPYALSYETGGWPILNWTLYTWGAPALAVATAAVIYRGTWAQLPPGQRLPGESLAPMLLGLLAVALGFAFVNVEVSHAFQPDVALSLFGQGLLQGMTRSLAWGAYGVFVLVLGGLAQARWLRLVGFAGILLATAKVFLVDLWALSGFVRVGSLLGLGVFLIIAALLFERLVLREPKEEAP